jgi:small subunit ribosomal protein S4
LLTELPGLGKPGAMERRAYPPGQHGQIRRKFSEYGLRLREKQKILFNYCLREEQLRRFVKKAKTGSGSDWTANLVGLLETRLDNVVFRLGFAASIPAARQLVGHGKVLVNGERIDISSAQVKVGSEISLTAEAYKNARYQDSIRQPRLQLADWLEHIPHGENQVGKLKMQPDKDAIPFPIELRFVTEYYAGI